MRALTWPLRLARRLALSLRLHADPVLRYTWRRCWCRAGEL